jgi:hypothetical protein
MDMNEDTTQETKCCDGCTCENPHKSKPPVEA